MDIPGVSRERALAMCLDPMYRGIRGKKVGPMKTLAEVRLNLMKQKEKRIHNASKKSNT